jgi:hypothetical protein
MTPIVINETVRLALESLRLPGKAYLMVKELRDWVRFDKNMFLKNLLGCKRVGRMELQRR